MLLHATAVAVGGRAVLLTGASGRGKSDLALRLIDRRAVLIADDQVRLSDAVGQLWAHAPPTIAGLIEVRGLGLVQLPWVDTVPVALVVDLDGIPVRLPEPATLTLLGHRIALITLAAFEASAVLKVEHALTSRLCGVEPPP